MSALRLAVHNTVPHILVCGTFGVAQTKKIRRILDPSAELLVLESVATRHMCYPSAKREHRDKDWGRRTRRFSNAELGTPPRVAPSFVSRLTPCHSSSSCVSLNDYILQASKGFARLLARIRRSPPLLLHEEYGAHTTICVIWKPCQGSSSVLWIYLLTKTPAMPPPPLVRRFRDTLALRCMLCKPPRESPL